MFTKFLFLYNLIYFNYGYNIAIVGSNGNLGREIVYQSLFDKGFTVLGLTSNPYSILEPSRINSFNYNNNNLKEIKSDNLTLYNYWSNIDQSYNHLIFCTNAKPFKKDYSVELTKKLIYNLPSKCRSISLVSAFGVGDSIKNGNLGIKIMNNFYLKDIYRSKNIQEKLILNLNNPNIKKFIYRPNALSFGETLLNSIPRKILANEILNNIELYDKEYNINI